MQHRRQGFSCSPNCSSCQTSKRYPKFSQRCGSGYDSFYSLQKATNITSFCRCYSCSRTRHTRIIFVRSLSFSLCRISGLFVAEYKDALPPLNQNQITKLKHLTIVSLAEQRRVSISRRLGCPGVLICPLRSSHTSIFSARLTSRVCASWKILLSTQSISTCSKASSIKKRNSWRCHTLGDAT